MPGCKATYHPGKLLCTVSLVFSLFTLTGNTIPTPCHMQQTIVAGQYASVKRTVTYKTAPCHRQPAPLNALLAYNSLIKVKYAQQAEKQEKMEINAVFRQLKMIPPTPFEALPA